MLLLGHLQNKFPKILSPTTSTLLMALSYWLLSFFMGQFTELQADETLPLWMTAISLAALWYTYFKLLNLLNSEHPTLGMVLLLPPLFMLFLPAWIASFWWHLFTNN